MRNNEAVLDCLKRKIALQFKNNFYVIDLSRCILNDNWIDFTANHILYKINFIWDNEPKCTIHELINYRTSKNGTPISFINILGTKREFFGDEHFEIDDELLEHAVLNQLESDINEWDYDSYSKLIGNLLKNEENKKILFSYLSQSAQENLKEGTTTKRY